MPTHQRDLTALLGSRICHDLISPLGAIGNGVELLQMGGSIDGPEMGLIVESVANANARIRFFRVAYGAAREGQKISNSELRDILKSFGAGGRVSYEWNVLSDLPRSEGKLAFLLIQCLESAMPYGGNIVVEHDGAQWQLLGRAEKMKINPEIWGVMSDPNTSVEVTPALVHFALVPEALKATQKKMNAELRETEISIRF
ncbi:histidine phosphotransferase family protein [Falsihalocynthiibacter sp. S25ZX9]|uniref:Histidine phosphotransferase n=1 Tax=Falsihalocynthiibacter arcticus TaxID=1579316 RepID=A0A126V3A1_9RHOB|nr:histidine phosphotransferase family protein [Falsihalocynthiibacter arcticus]AML52794.1 histidine phosphotransferase [Falsihalocynthiibacter arcticus]